MKDTFAFTHEMSVRDYECDIQGIVNNGVYMNYLEHVRHLFLKHLGLDFLDFAQRGINLVVVRAELDYRQSLTSGDDFLVGVNLVRVSKLRFAFEQTILRLPEVRKVMDARIIGTAIGERGRPVLLPEVDALLPDAN